MNRANALALALSSLVIGTVAATVPPAGSPATPGSGGRTTPPSLARRAFASRDNVQVRSVPSETAPVEGTFGLGSGFLVGPEAVPGWFPIVREWVNEDGSRTTRDLAFVSAADIVFTDPRRTAVVQPLVGQAPASERLVPGQRFVAQIPSGAIATTLGTAPDPAMLGTPQSFVTVRVQPRSGIAMNGSVIARHEATGQEVAIPDSYVLNEVTSSTVASTAAPALLQIGDRVFVSIASMVEASRAAMQYGSSEPETTKKWRLAAEQDPSLQDVVVQIIAINDIANAYEGSPIEFIHRRGAQEERTPVPPSERRLMRVGFNSPIRRDTSAPTTPRSTASTGQQAVKPGHSDGGECDLFVSVNWPSNVDDFKKRLDTVASATDRSIRDCPGLARAQRDEWAVFFAQWREFANRPTPTFGAGREWDSVCAYAHTLDGWRETIAATNCALVGPTNIHGYEVSPGVENILASVATIVKWGAVTLGGALLFSTFYPEIRAATAALRARRAKR